MHDSTDSARSDSHNTGRQNIEVWNDLVSPRDLLICLAVCSLTSVLALVIASRTDGQLLFWGLGGSVLGFILSCFLVTPKRHVVIVEETAEEEAL